MYQFVANLLPISLFICWIPAAVEAEPVRLGILTDFSGPMSYWGAGTRTGAELARDEILANGGKLSLFFGDHQLQPKTAVAELQKLTDVDRIDGLYSEFAPTVLAIAPIIERKKLPMIYSAAATSPLQICSTCFKSYLDFVGGCKCLGNYWRSIGIKRPGFLRLNIEPGDLCLSGMKAVFPEILESEYSSGDDVSSQILRLRRKKVDAILNIGFEPDFLRTLRSLRDLKFNVPIGTQEDAISQNALSQEPDSSINIDIFGFSPPSKEFVKKFSSKLSSSGTISAAALAYTHIKQLYRAITMCQNDDIKCKISAISSSPPDHESGFSGWNNRIAEFSIETRVLKPGTGPHSLEHPTLNLSCS